MLTETDPRVLATINLRAVLGALPRLAELSAPARALLAGLARPVALTIAVRGVGDLRLVFSADGIVASDTAPGIRARLVVRSPPTSTP